MPTKVRKQIYIEPSQDAALKELAGQEGVSEAEIIRRAIDAHIGEQVAVRERRRAWQEELAFINQLISQGAVPGGRTWKREDLYDRPKRRATASDRH